LRWWLVVVGTDSQEVGKAAQERTYPGCGDSRHVVHWRSRRLRLVVWWNFSSVNSTVVLYGKINRELTFEKLC